MGYYPIKGWVPPRVTARSSQAGPAEALLVDEGRRHSSAVRNLVPSIIDALSRAWNSAGAMNLGSLFLSRPGASPWTRAATANAGPQGTGIRAPACPGRRR